MSAAEPLTPAGRLALEKVLALLAAERASVSSVRRGPRAWDIHVLDSLSGLGIPELGGASRIADVGSGSGFPGLALAAALPAAKVDLIESVERKCAFMRRAAEEAGIDNARVVCDRAETWAAGDGRESYPVVTARAVGRLSTLAELASPLLRDDGVLVAWKGRRDPEEEAEAAAAEPHTGMRPETVLAVAPFPESRNRHLHVLRKCGSTPANLPRRPGVAKRRPYGARPAAGGESPGG
jgi:16S rRNA (guanine527-N7)-methyltransferase